MIRQGGAVIGPDGNPLPASAVGVPAGYYGPTGQATPIGFDQRVGQDGYPAGGRADFQTAQRADGQQVRPADPAPWTNSPAVSRDPRQLPGQEPPTANPLRGEYQ